MLNPLELQTAVVNALLAIHDLVDLVGDMAYIQAYDDESIVSGSTELSVASMMGRSVMVYWTGAELPRTGETRGWQHNFKIALKAECIATYYRLAQTIMDGQPDGYSDNFLNCEIHPDCDGIQDALIEPDRSADGVDRLAITFSLFER